MQMDHLRTLLGPAPPELTDEAAARVIAVVREGWTKPPNIAACAGVGEGALRHWLRRRTKAEDPRLWAFQREVAKAKAEADENLKTWQPRLRLRVPFRLPTIKGHSLGAAKLSRTERADRQMVLGEELPLRPPTRGDCRYVPRPCPFVSCTKHLKYDERILADGRGSILKDNFPEFDIADMEETCSSDVADDGPQEATRIARLMNLTPQRVLQIQQVALLKMRRALEDSIGRTVTSEEMQAAIEILKQGEEEDEK